MKCTIKSVLLLITSLLFLLAACSTQNGAGTAPGTDVSESNSGNTLPAITDAYNTIYELSAERLSEIENEVLEVSRLVGGIYDNADKGTALNVVLSDETVEKMMSTISTQGYSVTDGDGNQDMKNPDAIMAFGEAVNAGNNASATYYTVYSDGRIGASFLSFENGISTLIAVSLEWNDELEPEIYDKGKYSLLEVKYTEKGWLIYNRDVTNLHLNKKFNINSYTLLRVAPYDNALRELRRKYLGVVSYSENNMFTTTWSDKDYGALDFNCLFPYLFGAYHNCDPLLHYNANQFYDLVPCTDLHLIPTEDFESVVRRFFNVDADKLRELADYSDKYGGYFMLGWQTGYYSVIPRLPEPEITDFCYNDDGTLTLTVDAIFPWFGTDCAFTHELTVCDTQDGGFIYVSNFFYESESNIMYDCALADARQSAVMHIEH